MVKFRFIKKYKVALGIAALVFLAAAPSFYFYRLYQKAQYNVQNPNEVAKNDAKETVAKVGKLISLPADEEPTIAMVTDVTRLQDQAFFANARNGDKVLIYSKAKKAVLYRPETNLIIEVAPVNIGNGTTPTPSPEPQSGPTEIPTPTVPSTPTPTVSTTPAQ